MGDDDGGLFRHLLKIPASSASEETLAQVLETLWRTRKTGLAPLQKPVVQSLLGIPSIQELDPVLVCLRLIIRKSVHENLTVNDIQRLFPSDLPIDFQSILLMLLERYQSQWGEEASRDQPLRQQERVSHQVKNLPSAFTPFQTQEMPSSMWPRQDDATYYNHNCFGPTSVNAESNLLHTASMPPQQDNGSLDGQVIFPRLKSMTWTMENRNSTHASRVAVICLKLQDYTKSPSGEIEVKFQLTKDTLEAMLRSMAYISDQLSNPAVTPSEPVQKKQKQ